MGRRILVADDSSTIQKVIKIAFSRFDAEMVEAGSFIEALTAVGRTAPDVLILDASLPGARGPADFAKLAENANGSPVLLLVGTYESIDEAEFRKVGFTHFLKKPFDSGDLVSLVERLVGGSLGAVQESQRPVARHNTTVIHPPGVFAPGGATNPQQTPPAAAGRGQTQTPAFELSDDDFADDDAGLPGLAVGIEAALPGGLGGSGLSLADDEDEGPRHPLPPPPLTDQRRRGRRAFGGLADEGEGVGEPALDVTKAPGAGLGPLPAIPVGAGFGGDGGDTLATGLGLGRDEESSPRRPGAAKPPKAPPAATQDLSRQSGANSLAALRPLIDAELPLLVRQALEEYCERHFKSLAREVIASELRRLADEKARHLVDS